MTPSPRSGRPLRAHVLVIQDHEGDGALLEQVWGVDPEIKLTAVTGGVLALAQLKTVQERIPNLVLLAGRFPLTPMPALDVLVALKADPQLQMAPVVIISGADSPDIIQAFYAHHAACVIAFPETLNELAEVLAVMKAFWLGIARLPRETDVFYE